MGVKPFVIPFNLTIRFFQNEGTPYKILPTIKDLWEDSYTLLTLDQTFLFMFIFKHLTPHFNAATTIHRHLKSSPGKDIFYSNIAPIKLHGYADSDLARCLDSKKSITSYRVSLGPSLISWKSKKQNTVSRSSTDSSILVSVGLIS